MHLIVYSPLSFLCILWKPKWLPINIAWSFWFLFIIWTTEKQLKELLILLNIMCDEMVHESSQRSVMNVYEHSDSSQKIMVIVRGKAGIFWRKWANRFSWWFRQTYFNYRFFLKIWLLLVVFHSNMKNKKSSKGMWWQIVQSQIHLSCCFRSAALPLPAPMRIFIAFVVISFTPGA